VFQEVDIIVANAIPRFVVKDAVGTDTGSARRNDRYASVEACMGSLFYVWAVTEPLVFKEIVDDMNFAGVFMVAIGSFVAFRDIDGVLTDRKASASDISRLFATEYRDLSYRGMMVLPSQSSPACPLWCDCVDSARTYPFVWSKKNTIHRLVFRRSAPSWQNAVIVGSGANFGSCLAAASGSYKLVYGGSELDNDR